MAAKTPISTKTGAIGTTGPSAASVATPARRGRPSGADMENRGDTRLGLIMAARDVMIARDTVDFTLSQIAAITGQSPALVQYHFGSKEGLLQAVIELDASAAVAGMVKLQAEDMPVGQKMRLHINGLLNAYLKAPYANRLLQALVQGSTPEAGRRVTDTFMKPVADFQASLLAQGLREGVFKAIDPMDFFFILVGSCDHFFSRRSVMAHVFGVDRIDRALKDRYCRSLTEIIMAGIEATPGQRPV